ncbi:MAG: hypothetical protein RSE98_01600, partial [Anaerovoracaceae bacterium]
RIFVRVIIGQAGLWPCDIGASRPLALPYLGKPAFGLARIPRIFLNPKYSGDIILARIISYH